MPMPAGTIVAENLTKVYRTVVRKPGAAGALQALIRPDHQDKVAVGGISLRVGQGELLALLGPNGAGKSTTIKMLCGILTPTGGTVEVNGIVPHRDRIANARRIGVVFGQRTQLWRDLPARTSLEVLRDIYGLSSADFQARIAEFNRILELEEFWETRARQLSLGQRVRCDLAQRRGRTVLLTTHDMTEVAKLAERVALIDHGRLVYDGKTAGLHDLSGVPWQVHVTVDEIPATTAVPGLRMTRAEGERLPFAPDHASDLSPRQAVRRLIEHLPVTDIRLEEPDLEDVVRAAFARGDTVLPGDTPNSPHELGAGR